MATTDFERLLGVVNQLRTELDLVNQSVSAFQRQFEKTGALEFNKVLAQQRLLAQDLTKQLVAAEQQYTKMFNAARGGQGAAQTIPNAKGTAQPAEQVLRNSLKANFFEEGGREATLAQQRAAEEQELLKSLRHRISSEERYAQAIDQARAAGFDVNNLARVQQKGTSGIQQLQFAKTDASGVQQRFDTFVNPAGKATPGISNQFRSFGQGVVRDIGELTKWSFALAAVYGPLNKLKELTQTMIENQTKLAEATVSVNSSFIGQAEIFNASADAANRAGEGISGVIDAFTQSYRAAGGSSNEVERFATANKLLADSLILSKLSTLDQASAIDTLSAALRQTTGNLSGGTELLDKWVRVTKVANVDLATLATGFAVVGDAAETAGIDVDQLNGLIAAIAETGISSGKETANIARSLVSGFQSDSAKKALDELGIAGENFLDTMKQIYNLRQQGVISDEQFSKLTLALGGGTRRQAAYSSFIENFDRVFQVADQSAKANGDAQAALAKQLETVQTSLTRLSNAFQELAQSLGVEGGFLGIIQGTVNGLTAMVKAFDGVVSVLGKATPALVAFVAASLLLKSRGIGSIQEGLGGIGKNISTTYEEGRLAAAGQGLSAYRPSPGQKTSNFIGNNVLGNNVSSGAFQGLALSIIPALQNAFNKEDKYGKLKAGADVVGGVAGGIIGALTTGSPIIGAAIGTAISEAFVNSTVARKTDIFSFNKQAGLGTSFAPSTADDKNAALTKAVEGLYKSIGGGNEAVGKLTTSGTEKTAAKLVDQINNAIESQDKTKLERVFSGRGGGQAQQLLSSVGITQDFIKKAFRENKPIEFAPEAVAYNSASAAAKKAYDEALAARTATESGPNISTYFANQVGANSQAFKPLLESISSQFKQQISQERVSGNLKGTAYTQQIGALGGYDTKALQYYTAFGKEFEKINKDVKTSADLFKAFADITVYGSQESVNELTGITGEISTILNLLNDPTLKNKDLLDFAGTPTSRADLQKRLAELQQTGGALATDTYQSAQLSRLKVPNVQGDITKPLTSPELESVKKTAIGLQEQFYKGFLKIPDQLYEGLQKSWDEWAQVVKDSGDTFFETVSNIDPQFFQQAMQKLIDENKLKSQQQSQFGIQQVDLSSSQGANLQQTVDYYSNYLSKNFPQYQQKPEDLGIIFNDYVTTTLHGDNLAVKLALEKLVDINQKQLDGQYNIPEGATFWVPLTAAYYRNKGGDGTGSIDTSNLDSSANNLDGSAIALERAAEALRQTAYWKGEKQDSPAITKPVDIKQLQYEHTLRENDPLRTLNRKSEEAGYGIPSSKLPSQIIPSGNAGSGATPFLDTLLNGLRNLFTTIGGSNPFGRLGTGGGLQSTSPSIRSAAGIGQANANPAPVSKLDLKIQSTTNLSLDGRVLATAMQNFLAQDLLKTEATQGSITKRYVI